MANICIEFIHAIRVISRRTKKESERSGRRRTARNSLKGGGGGARERGTTGKWTDPIKTNRRE